MCVSRSSIVSRWHYWIRAWDSGEPATSHRQLEHSNALHSGVQGWADSQYDDRCIPVARWRGRMTAKSTRYHALGRMAVSRLEMRYFSLCKIAQSEPSRSGAGTWLRQAHSQATPSADGLVFNTSGQEQWPGRTCRPRLLEGDGPASQARHHGRPANVCPHEQHEAPAGTER